MGLEKLIKNLKMQLGKGEQGKSGAIKRIDSLLEQLAKKQNKLKRKIDGEKNPSRRKKLKLELKIASLQRKKGLSRRKELAK